MPCVPFDPESIAGFDVTTYRTRLATTEEDIRAAQRLRFEVFNVELQEGLSESWRTQLDSDRFDATCDHLIIEHIATGKIVGTYRLQTGEMAVGDGVVRHILNRSIRGHASANDQVFKVGHINSP